YARRTASYSSASVPISVASSHACRNASSVFRRLYGKVSWICAVAAAPLTCCPLITAAKNISVQSSVFCGGLPRLFAIFRNGDPELSSTFAMCYLWGYQECAQRGLGFRWDSRMAARLAVKLPPQVHAHRVSPAGQITEQREIAQ